MEQKNYYTEVHYSPQQLSKLWGLSARFIRDLFAHVPGVLKIDRPEERYKRGYSTIRIPISIAERVHASLAVKR